MRIYKTSKKTHKEIFNVQNKAGIGYLTDEHIVALTLETNKNYLTIHIPAHEFLDITGFCFDHMIRAPNFPKRQKGK